MTSPFCACFILVSSALSCAFTPSLPP
jgi:hypothetical protein